MALINAAISVQRPKGQWYWRDCASGCVITVMVLLRREEMRSTLPNPAKAVHMGMIICIKP